MMVAWTRPAVADLRALRDYIATDNPKAARGTADRLLGAVQRLTQFPASGRPGRVPYTRELVIADTPYLIVYRVSDETVEILRVIHGARQWPV